MGKLERFNEHLHSTRRTAAGDRERDARTGKSLNARDRSRRKDLLVSNECAINIGEHELDQSHDEKSELLPKPTVRVSIRAALIESRA